MTFARECDQELYAAGALTAHAVWERLALAGFVPDAWLADRSRRFRRARRRRYVPRTAWDALTIAALVPELPTLEALAREAAARLCALRAPARVASLDTTTAFWRVAAFELDGGFVATGALVHDALDALGSLFEASIERLAADANGRTRPSRWGWPRVPLRVAVRWRNQRIPTWAIANLPWAVAQLQGWRRRAIDGNFRTDEAFAARTPVATGTRISALPDPLEPLGELLGAGVVLRDALADGLQLYVPMLPTSVLPELAPRWCQRP